MEIVKWANNKGQTLTLSKGEAEELQEAIKQALSRGEAECGRFEVEIEE